jgi:hypothetical protein
MAVVSGVTVVPNARIAGVALTGVHGYKAIAAMGKTLELDGGKRVLRRQEGGRAHQSDEPLFHTFPHASMPRILQRWLSESMNFRRRALPIRQLAVYYENESGRRTRDTKEGRHHAADRLCIHSRNADMRGHVRSVSRRVRRIPPLAPLHRHTARASLWVSALLVATRPVSLVFFWDPGTLGVLV